MPARTILAAYRRLARTQRSLAIQRAKLRWYEDQVKDAETTVRVAEALGKGKQEGTT